ncbi:MAG: alpha-amylase family protein [Candidatus Latescibacterota bacterium]|jgi:hypothetical protein
MARTQLAQRQIHLDFHTGPAIPDVGADFDARAFARTMKEAHVNSVTVFAKCHHGHLYFPTTHPSRHPGLKKGLDLTGRQVEALHREGIRAPIYISVQCDEFAADTHPEWIARNVDGTNVGSRPLGPGWQILDMTSPYQDYLAEQIEEVLQRYKPVDGIFFDMCWNQPSVSNWAVEAMLAQGLNPEREEDRNGYASELALTYMKRYYRQVKAVCPRATVYFNSRPLSLLSRDLQCLSHVEIEALPTGGWGYIYFPQNVRYVRTFDRPYMGMTARFHKSWADFGGLKPLAALKYEVCQMLAHGAACSIGDQLHPRGVLDRAAYDLIGQVYGYAEACEPWWRGAEPMTEIGLFQVTGGGYLADMQGTNTGAVRLLTQLKLQFDVVDADSRFEGYRLLILPDSVRVDAALARKLRAFLKQGGSLLLTGASGLDLDGRPILSEAGIRTAGDSPFTVTYLRFGRRIAAGVPPTDHVFYERGIRMLPARGAESLAAVVEPYFERTYEHFSSHHQTPPSPSPSRYSAAIRKGSVITVPYPLFQAYARHANLPCRWLVEKCVDLLLGERLVRVTAPSTTEVTVMRQGKRTIVHLLQFVAERRGDLDIVEDVVPLREVPLSVQVPKRPTRAYLAPSREAVPVEYADGRASLNVPMVDGHQMVVLE